MSILGNLFHGRTAQAKVAPILRASDGTKLDAATITTCFDLAEISHCYENLYLLGKNQDKAVCDILSLNGYWQECRRVVGRFPTVTIRERDLCFKQKMVNGFNQFCFLSFAPLTKTGKAPKYPMTLHFHVSGDLFGSACYGHTGAIERAELCAWHKGTCWTVLLAAVDGALSVSAIYKQSPTAAKKEKVYPK